MFLPTGDGNVDVVAAVERDSAVYVYYNGGGGASWTETGIASCSYCYFVLPGVLVKRRCSQSRPPPPTHVCSSRLAACDSLEHNWLLVFYYAFLVTAFMGDSPYQAVLAAGLCHD